MEKITFQSGDFLPHYYVNQITEMLFDVIEQFDSALDIFGDFEIMPVFEGLTEKIVIKSAWASGLKYRVFAGDTPYTNSNLSISEPTITAKGGFEGSNVKVKFYDSNDNELLNLQLDIKTLNGRKIGHFHS